MTLRALYDVPAPAKLNLFLHVVGRRADGYHLLQSLFVLIDWADRLHFERREDGRLARHDLGAPLPADDLCLRAARALAAASGTSHGADIHIEKQVPAGAGMGGGSSDAATTLLALNRLWGLNWPRVRLAALALPLGADVPFFLFGRAAFVEGIGERLAPVAMPQASYAVLKPASSLPTAEIFSHPLLKRDTPPIPGPKPAEVAGPAVPQPPGAAGAAAILAGSFEGGAEGTGRHAEVWVGAAPGFGRNDLQAAAEHRCPEVAQAARWLEARYGNSRMTGSGSAVFARVESMNRSLPGTAASTEAMPAPGGPPGVMAGLPAGWVGRLCQGLAEHPLVGWAG